MGTYVTPGNTKADTIAEILADYRPTDHAVVGNSLWAVVQVNDDGSGSGPHPIIALFLLTHGGSGYKPMDESEGPYYFDCPKRLLDAVPDPRVGYSTSWRERCARFQRGSRAIDLTAPMLDAERRAGL